MYESFPGQSSSYTIFSFKMSNVMVKAVFCSWTVRNYTDGRVAKYYVGAGSYIRLFVIICEAITKTSWQLR